MLALEDLSHFCAPKLLRHMHFFAAASWLHALVIWNQSLLLSASAWSLAGFRVINGIFIQVPQLRGAMIAEITLSAMAF